MCERELLYAKEEIVSLKNMFDELLPKVSSKNLEEIASSYKTSGDLLRGIACNETIHLDIYVYDGIAQNENCSNETLSLMINSPFENPRMAVAKSFQATSEMLDILSKDHISTIRIEVVKNENISEETLNSLTNDENKKVRELASEILNDLTIGINSL